MTRKQHKALIRSKAIKKKQNIARIKNRAKSAATVAVAGAFLATSNISAQGIIEEIVVTGTKNETPIIDETGNLSFINSEEINFLSADNRSNIINRMPGVFISQGSGQEHLTSIRSPVLSGGAGAGSFLYLEDGIPLRSPAFSNVNG